MEPQVLILREFRDRFMLSNVLGKGFVRLYYTYSPPIAKFIAKHDSLRAMVRISLLPVVGVSWVVLMIGPASTMALILLLFSGFIGFVWFRRKYKQYPIIINTFEGRVSNASAFDTCNISLSHKNPLAFVICY